MADVTTRMRVADYLSEQLVKNGVDTVFLLSGGGMMHLLDSVGRTKGLSYVCNHHEQAGTMAADAYSRVKSGLAASYATSGPGGTNTLTGILGAWVDSAPVLVVTGQSKVSQTIRGTKSEGLRQFGTFEVDIVPMVESVTKYAAFVSDAKDIRYHFERALHEATTGRPGPVLLDIPVDVQGAMIDPTELRGFTPPVASGAAKTEWVAELKAGLEKFKTAKKPLILAGHGVRTAGLARAFRTMIEAINVPVVTTQLATDLLPYDHPLYVGHPGMKGDRAGNFAVQGCDALLVLGSSLHVLTTGYELDRFSPNSFKIQIEPDAAILKREEVGVDVQVNADLREALEFIAPSRSKGAADTAVWRKHCLRLKTELAVMNEPHFREGEKPNYYDLIDALSSELKGDEIITADAGSAFYVVGQAFRVKKNQRVIVSGGLGTMGYALPAATGAAYADRAKNVFCVTGDGSLQTNIHELAVIRQTGVNVKIVVVNNDGYVSIRNTQKNFFGGFLVGTSPSSGVFLPKLEALAEAYELPYMKVEKAKDLKAAMATLANMEGPMICEVFTHADQEIIPTVTSKKRADGSMESKPLHDMYPFFDEAKVKDYLG